MSDDEPTLFERIIAREIPAEFVYESDDIIAIRDIAPKAPVHLLIVPKTSEYADVVELADADPDLLADMVAVARDLAAEYTDGSFRLIFNTGAASGQTIFHVHAHLLGGSLGEGSLGD